MNFMMNRDPNYILPLEPPDPRPYVSCLVSGVFCANKLLYCFVLYCTIVLSDGFLSETKQLKFASDKIPTLEFKNSSDKFQIGTKNDENNSSKYQ